MKKTLLTVVALGFAVAAFGQGQVNLINLVSGVVRAPVFGPESSDPTKSIQGNTSIGIPAGDAQYNSSVWVAGTGFTAQLWGGPVGGTMEALSPTTTFRAATSAAQAGYLNGVTVVVPTVGYNQPGTFFLRAWDNKGGTITSWTQVEADLTILRGESATFNLILPGATGGSANMVGLQSFNLHTAIPEPSVIALGVLGIGALVLFRRRK